MTSALNLVRGADGNWSFANPAARPEVATGSDGQACTASGQPRGLTRTDEALEGNAAKAHPRPRARHGLCTAPETGASSACARACSEGSGYQGTEPPAGMTPGRFWFALQAAAGWVDDAGHRWGGKAPQNAAERAWHAPWNSDAPLSFRTRSSGALVATRGDDPDAFGHDRNPPGQFNDGAPSAAPDASLWGQLSDPERAAWLAESPAEASASRDGREAAGTRFSFEPAAKGEPRPDRDWPRLLSELDREALEFWARLSERERSLIGPPTVSLARLAALGGGL